MEEEIPAFGACEDNYVDMGGDDFGSSDNELEMDDCDEEGNYIASERRVSMSAPGAQGRQSILRKSILRKSLAPGVGEEDMDAPVGKKIHWEAIAGGTCVYIYIYIYIYICLYSHYLLFTMLCMPYYHTYSHTNIHVFTLTHIHIHTHTETDLDQDQLLGNDVGGGVAIPSSVVLGAAGAASVNASEYSFFDMNTLMTMTGAGEYIRVCMCVCIFAYVHIYVLVCHSQVYPL